MQSVLAFIAANPLAQQALALVGCVVLASIITALGKHPTPATNEVVEFLQIALDRLSVLSHKDCANTMKLPGTASQPVTSPNPATAYEQPLTSEEKRAIDAAAVKAVSK